MYPETKKLLTRNSLSVSRNKNCTVDINYVLLPCIKLSRISKRHFDSKFFTCFLGHILLYGTDFCLIWYQICMWTDVESFLFQLYCLPFFFQFNVTTWFLQDTFFQDVEVFAKNIVTPGGTLYLYIDKKETLFTCQPSLIARWPFLIEKRRIKICFFLGVKRTCFFFFFLANEPSLS